jgi:hypothetical protein
MADKKHNWFHIDGVIRTDKEMTAAELVELMDAAGFEFLGNVKASDISDEDYDADFREGLKESLPRGTTE